MEKVEEKYEFNQDPILDGSILAIAYSGSKKSNLMEFSSAEPDPIQMVRMAMHHLSVLNERPEAETIDRVQTLLQGVEEYLEENTRLHSTVKRRLATKFSHFLSPTDDYSKEPLTPVFDRIDYSKHKSIVMENQLDLNESEIDYFEEIINDLAERLEKMKEERDELQSITNSLGDRLQRISREKDEQIQDISRKLEREMSKHEAHIHSLFNENQTLKDRESKLLEQVRTLTFKLDQSENTINITESSVVHNIDYGTLLDSKNEKIKFQAEQNDAFQILVEDERANNRSLKARVATLEASQKDILTVMSGCIAYVSENLKVSELQTSDIAIYLSPMLNVDLDFALSSVQKYLHKSTDLLNKISQENIDLRIHSETVNGKFLAKSTAYDQMCDELHDTRKQLDLQCKVIDELRLLNLKLKADSQINDASLDNQIELLKTYCKNLEAKTVDFAESIKMKEIELANERERSLSYLTLVEKLGEKDDTTEELLSRLKNENFDLKDELTQTHDNLKLRCIEVEQLIAKLNSFESENSQLHSYLDDIKRKLLRSEEELDTNKDVFTQFKIDVNLKLNHLCSVVDNLTKENGGLKLQLDLEHSKSVWNNEEIQLREKDNEKNWSDMHNASSILVQYKTAFDEAFKFMEDCTSKSLNSFEDRIDKMYCHILVFQREFSKLKSNFLSKDALKLSFDETQQSLRDAIDRRFKDEQVIHELQDQLLSLRSEYIECEEAFREVQSKLRNKDQQYSNDGFSTRLVEAENRAEEMASEQAKLFAQSSRIIAYLEGENSRLKNMCDHFRMANSKLMVELKGSLYSELRLKTVENKLKTAHEIEDASLKRLKQYEELLNQKNEEYSRTLTVVHNEYRDKMLQIQSDSDRTCDSLSELKVTLSKATVEKENLASQLVSLKNSSDNILRDHRKKCEQYESELNSMKNLVEDIDYECKMSRETIQELTMTNSQYEMKLSILSQEFQEYKLSSERLSHDLRIELQEKSQKISSLESDSLVARAKQIEAESNAIMLSEEVTKTLLKRVGTEDEVRLLRENVELCKAENSKVHQINTNLKIEVQKANVEIESLILKLNNLEKMQLPAAIEKTHVMEKQISNLESQLRIAQNDLGLCKQLLERSKSDLSSSEVLIQELQNKVNALYSEEQLLKTSNETLTEDNQLLQFRLHSLLEKIQYLEDRHSQLRKDIDVLSESNILLESQLTTEKNRSTSFEEISKVMEKLLQEVNKRFSDLTKLLLSTANSEFDFDFEHIQFDKLCPNIDMIPILTECNSNWEEFHSSLRGLLTKSHGLRNKLDTEIGQLEEYRKINEDLKYSNEKLFVENEELKMAAASTKAQIRECEQSLNFLDEQVGVMRTANIELNKNLSSLCKVKSLWLKNMGEKISEIFENLGVGSISVGQLSLTSVNYDSYVSIDTLAIFNSFTSETESCILLWMQIVESIRDTCKEAKDECLLLRKTMDSKENKWNEDQAKSSNDLKGALAENSVHLQTINELKSLIDGQCTKINDLNNAIEEISKNNAELEQEFHITADLNSQLKQSISESDALINELKAVIRSHEVEIESKIVLIANLQDQLAVFRKRVMDFESLNERNNSLINRLKFEKDALDNVRKSLESEVERYERTKHQLLEEASQTVSIDKFLMDFETSVCIIFSTVSQIEEQLHLKVLVDTTLSADNIGTTESTNNFSKIMNKTQLILEKLGSIRTTLREDEKNRKAIDGKLLSATQQIENLNDTIIKLKAQYKSLEEEKSALNSQNAAKLDEIDKLRSSLSSSLHEKEDICKSFSHAQELLEKYAKEITELNRVKDTKESDIKGLAYELDLREHTIARLREELNAEKLSQKSTFADFDQKCVQYEAIKNSNHNLLLTIQHLEQSLSLEKQSTHLLEIKDKEIEIVKLTNCDLTNELQNTKFELEKVLRENQAITYTKTQAEKNTQALGQELDAMKKHSAMLELRMDIILQEKNSFLDEVNETRRKIQVAKESFEFEKVQRLKSEATAEALKRAHGEDRKKLFSEFSSLQFEFQNNSHEDEIRILKSKLQQIELELIDKDSKIKFQQEERKLLIKEIEASQIHLKKKSEELAVATNYSNLLRQEGKVARKKSLEILGVLKEICQTINLDLKISVEFGPDTISLSHFSLEAAENLNLCDTLGLNDILSSSNMLRDILSTYRSEFRRLRSVSIQWETTETENGNIRRKLHENERIKADAEHRYDDNIKLLQQQIFQLRNIESQCLQANHQISSLESALARERELKEASLIQLSALKSQLGNIQIASSPIVHDNCILLKEIDSLKSELEKIAKINDELTQEIDAINFHRTVLKNTIEEVEQKMFDRIEYLVQAEIGSISSDTDLEKLKRELIRTKAKSKVIDDLSQIYRTGILALYSDGTSYSAAQFGWQPFSSKQDHEGQNIFDYITPGVGWIEREIYTLHRSFDEELHVLNDFISELYTKLKYSQKYSLELRKQFEDHMKAIYSVGKDGTSSIVIRQLEKMRIELEESQKVIFSLEDDLQQELLRSQNCHATLVNDVSNALQCRDSALLALKKLELFCKERNFPIGEFFGVYEKLKNQNVTNVSVSYRAQQHEIHGNDVSAKFLNDKKQIMSVRKNQHHIEKDPVRQNREMHINSSYMLRTVDSTAGASTLRISRSKHK